MRLSVFYASIRRKYWKCASRQGELEKEIEKAEDDRIRRLSKENEEMKGRLNKRPDRLPGGQRRLQSPDQIMDRARKLALLEEEEDGGQTRFRMRNQWQLGADRQIEEKPVFKK